MKNCTLYRVEYAECLPPQVIFAAGYVGAGCKLDDTKPVDMGTVILGARDGTDSFIEMELTPGEAVELACDLLTAARKIL